MLEDLSAVIQKCRLDYDSLPNNGDIRLSKDLASVLKRELSTNKEGEVFTVNPFSISVANKSQQTAQMPSSWLWYGKTFWPLWKALCAYNEALTIISSSVMSGGISAKDLESYLKQLPNSDWANIDTAELNGGFKAAIDATITDPADKSKFVKLISDRHWWNIPLRKTKSAPGKTLDRGDVFEASMALATGTIVANSSKLKDIIKAFSQSKELRDCFDALPTIFESHAPNTTRTSALPSSKPADNIIFYGAPGSGKSYKVREYCDTEKNVITTVFHPDSQFNDFVGCLSPSVDSTGAVTYSFKAGPLVRALVMAATAPHENFYLVIEEINRASAAAVFGEVFQLLDREPDGSSSYKIFVSDKDMLTYLRENAPSVLDGDTYGLPSNLSILATMNSSDQAVMPMDTAFKRRWQFQYIGVDFAKSATGNIPISISNNDSKDVSWKDFACTINHILSQEQFPEDRLLGPWFVKHDEISNPTKSKKTIKGKVLLYLWDDVLRHSPKNKLFDPAINNFGELASRIDENKPVFNDIVLEALKTTLSSMQEPESILSDELPQESTSGDSSDILKSNSESTE